MAPMAPHVTAELWERRHGGHVHEQPWPVADAGAYRITAQVRSAPGPGAAEGKTLASDETVFLVRATDVETETPVANLALLRSLAHQTGGGFFAAADAAEAFQRLLQRKPPAELTRRNVQPLAASGLALGSLLSLFLAALTGEWILRKRKGLA